MARTVRDSRLETRAARERLKAQPKPYWRTIVPGALHLGYRKPRPGLPGWWCVRRYEARTGPGSPYRVTTIALADDYQDADGSAVLSFAEAQDRAHDREEAAQPSGPYTVDRACDDYLAFLESDGRSESAIKDARWRIDAFVRPPLGKFEVTALTPQQLRKWRSDLAKAKPRVRTSLGESQKYRDGTDDRARKATANRNLAILKAALNHAFDEEKIESNKAWSRRVKPFENVDAARVRFLQLGEAQRLVNACASDFRRMVQAALQTGARYSELARLRVEDFDPDGGTVHIRRSKSRKSRHIVLTNEGVAFFAATCAGKAGDAIMLPKADGSIWGKSHQDEPMAAACKRAKIMPRVSFHILRHTWASHAVMAGMPLMVVAKNLGHVDTRMVEKHYGHLAPSYVADEIRAKAPRFGIAEPVKVAALRKRGA